MSALILSALLMVLTFTANSEAFIARANLSNAEDHLQAEHSAAACGSIALRLLNLDSVRIASSAPIEVQLDEDQHCTILSGSTSGNSAESMVRSHVHHTVSLLYIQAVRASSTAPFIPQYWSELPPEM
jgi:hypothetical protein